MVRPSVKISLLPLHRRAGEKDDAEQHGERPPRAEDANASALDGALGEQDGEAARKQADGVETWDVENLRRGSVGAAADVIDVRDDEDGEDGRLADDEREHGHAAARRQAPVFIREDGNACSSFVLPVRIVGMLEVPQRAAAAHHRIGREVIRRRRRGRGPLQRPRIPWIVAGLVAVKVASRSGSRRRSAPRSPWMMPPTEIDHVERVPSAVGLVGVDGARHAENADEMHGVERDDGSR